MRSSTTPFAADANPNTRLDVLFEELAELTGQRNAIDSRIVDIVAEIDHDGLAGNTGVRSLPALVAWKTGCSPRNAATIAAVASRREQFPQCVTALREGRLSVDQVGVIAENAADGSDAHYAQLASVATVNQLRTAVRLEPRAESPKPKPEASISKSPTGPNGDFTTWRITLGKLEAAKFEAALDSHRDALVADWKQARDSAAGQANPYTAADLDHLGPQSDVAPPMPTALDAFLRLIGAGWDADVAARPHGQRTTVIAHFDLDAKLASLHLGPLLSDADRQYVSCDATCEVWFERNGRLVGTGRTTRTVNRRLRRALEYRDTCCVVPGCGATRGLHAHHVVHWENGGPTELWNLVLVCPYHHRLHHQGGITITGDADKLTITDRAGRVLTNQSLARPPTGPAPDVQPYQSPTGERAQWKYYDPFEPNPPPSPS